MFATMKNVTVDNNNAELIDFAQTVDFAALFEHVKAFVGVDCGFYQPEITTRHGDVYIGFMTEDITAQTGAFSAILERCYLHSFSNGVSTDKDSGDPYYWVSVSIAYEHKNGGSNGMEVVRAWHKNSAWEFLNAGERR